MKSIISNTKRCWVCGTDNNIHKHHVFEGVANRKKSEEDGCWVYLCGKHHNLSNEGVHFNKELDHKLKCLAQKKWEENFGDRDAFVKRFGENHIGLPDIVFDYGFEAEEVCEDYISYKKVIDENTIEWLIVDSLDGSIEHYKRTIDLENETVVTEDLETPGFLSLAAEELLNK